MEKWTKIDRKCGLFFVKAIHITLTAAHPVPVLNSWSRDTKPKNRTPKFGKTETAMINNDDGISC